MFLTKHKILKAIKVDFQLLGLRHHLSMMQHYGLLTKREEKLVEWVNDLMVDTKQNAILNYSDLSIVKRL